MGTGFGKDGRGVIIHENRSQAIGTFLTLTALLIGTKLNMTDAFRMLKSEIYVTISGLTAGDGEKMALYLAHGDLSIAEIKNALELAGPLSRGDIEGARRANRPIFLAGQFSADEVGTTSHLTDLVTGSHVAVMKPRWTFPDGGVGWNWVLWNFSTATVASGATIAIQSKCYGVWVGA